MKKQTLQAVKVKPQWIPIKCTTCHGWGKMRENDCPTCKGKGFLKVPVEEVRGAK